MHSLLKFLMQKNKKTYVRKVTSHSQMMKIDTYIFFNSITVILVKTSKICSDINLYEYIILHNISNIIKIYKKQQFPVIYRKIGN